MLRTLSVAVLAGAAILSRPLPAPAVVTQQSDATAMRAAGSELLQTRQYRLSERLPGAQTSIRQSVTVWEVTGGTWNGQSLQGLNLIVVSRLADSDSCASTTDCYVSYRASAAQRAALLNAFVSSQSLAPDDAASWRLEPAVIRVEHVGSLVIVHLGRVA
jgi:hypothetical protein